MILGTYQCDLCKKPIESKIYLFTIEAKITSPFWTGEILDEEMMKEAVLRRKFHLHHECFGQLMEKWGIPLEGGV